MNKRLIKHIGIIHSEYVLRGGAERKSLIMAHLLQPRFHVHIVCMALNPATTFNEYLYNTPIHVCHSRTRFGKLLSLFRMAWALRHTDIIIAHNHPVQFSAALAHLVFRIPVIWFCNEPMLYIGDYATRTPKMLMLRFCERWLARCFFRIVANSVNTRQQIKRFIGLDSVVIHSGLDLMRYPLTYTDRTHDHLQLIVIARLERHKEIDILFPVFDHLKTQFPYLTMLIIGNGTDKSRLTNLIEHRQIRILSDVSETDKIAYLIQSHVLLFPTHDEPLGVTPIEAMAAGVPVVAFNSGGVKETVVHNETGLLVETLEEFTHAVYTLLSNFQLARTMGQNGMARARMHFSQDTMVDKLLALIGQLA